MLSRLTQVTRHLSSPALTLRSTRAFGKMAAASVSERNSRTINTAACLIIGDEVLGGKVSHGFRNCGGVNRHGF